MNNNFRRGIALPLFAVALAGFNFSNLKGSDCIRAIHVVNLLVMGFALGMLVMNLITLYKNNKNV